MQGEIVRFRKKFFGGFNRDDVISYITGLASERNESLAAKENAESEIKSLENELSELREKLSMYEKLIEKLKTSRTGKDSKTQSSSPENAAANPAGKSIETRNTGQQKKIIVIRRKKNT